MASGEHSTIEEVPRNGESAPSVRLIAHPSTPNESVTRCRHVVTLIGTRAGCKIRLAHSMVSPVHVVLVNTGSEVIAVDLVTQNGTRLNGLKLEQDRLNDGDLLEIHPFEFRVDIGPSRPELAAGAGVMDLEPGPTTVALEHVSTGRILQQNREVCVIGRRAGCDILLDDPSVSRAHALLLSHHGHPAVFDLLSQNGTVVNGAPVRWKVLKDSDELVIGDSTFRMRCLGSPVVESNPQRNGKSAVKPEPVPGGPDMISIEAVDRSQRWRIVDDAKRAARHA